MTNHEPSRLYLGACLALADVFRHWDRLPDGGGNSICSRDGHLWVEYGWDGDHHGGPSCSRDDCYESFCQWCEHERFLELFPRPPIDPPKPPSPGTLWNFELPHINVVNGDRLELNFDVTMT